MFDIWELVRNHLQELKNMVGGPQLFEAICDDGTKAPDKTKVCKTIVAFLDSIPTSPTGEEKGHFGYIFQSFFKNREGKNAARGKRKRTSQQ